MLRGLQKSESIFCVHFEECRRVRREEKKETVNSLWLVRVNGVTLFFFFAPIVKNGDYLHPIMKAFQRVFIVTMLSYFSCVFIIIIFFFLFLFSVVFFCFLFFVPYYIKAFTMNRLLCKVMSSLRIAVEMITGLRWREEYLGEQLT